LCNGRDDNCDGIEDTGEPGDMDLVFAFDISGSMVEDMAAVAMAITRTAAMYNSPAIHMGLVIFPGFRKSNERGIPWEPEGLIPLQEFSTFQSAMHLTSLTLGISGGSLEASWDIVPMLIDGDVDGLELRPGSKVVVILFTDEMGQSYHETSPNDEDTMCGYVRDHDVSLYAIVLDHIFYDFDLCARTFELTRDPDTMVQYLEDITEDVCDPWGTK
jgi:hypothetical protein